MKPDHLQGSVKFFGVLQLTCDSIKIIPGSEQEAGDDDASSGTPAPTAPCRSGAEVRLGALLPSHSPSENVSGFS